MKKIRYLYICATVFTLLFSSVLNTKALTKETSNIEHVTEANSSIKNSVISTISFLENTNLSIENSYQLYDINDSKSYFLITFNEGGYAIVTEFGNVSEYSLNTEKIPYIHDNIECDRYIYAGPLNYIFKTNDNIYVDSHLNPIDAIETDELIEANNKMLSQKDDHHSFRATRSTWYGIDASRFSRYTNSSWKNYSNQCGPYSAGIMLAYYQDYIPSVVNFNSSIRPQNSTNANSLISTLAALTPSSTGTLPSDVAVGVASMLNNYNIAGSYATCFYSSGAAWGTATSKIDSGRLVCIGLSGLAGDNPYGWHWVTAYAYTTDGGSYYYRSNDNHGNSDVVISYSWTMGIVYLNQ